MTATVRVLGAHCTPKAVYFAIVEQATIVANGPQKIEIPDGLQSGSSLSSLADELRRRLIETKASHAALLQAQSYEGGPKATVARVGAETLLRTMAAELGIEMELLNRATARTRLGIAKSGKLDALLTDLLPSPVGKYWADRRYAAFAALACEKEVL